MWCFMCPGENPRYLYGSTQTHGSEFAPISVVQIWVDLCRQITSRKVCAIYAQVPPIPSCSQAYPKCRFSPYTCMPNECLAALSFQIIRFLSFHPFRVPLISSTHTIHSLFTRALKCRHWLLRYWLFFKKYNVTCLYLFKALDRIHFLTTTLQITIFLDWVVELECDSNLWGEPMPHSLSPSPRSQGWLHTMDSLI